MVIHVHRALSTINICYYQCIYTNKGDHHFYPLLLNPDNMSKTYLAQLPIHLSLKKKKNALLPMTGFCYCSSRFCHKIEPTCIYSGIKVKVGSTTYDIKFVKNNSFLKKLSDGNSVIYIFMIWIITVICRFIFLSLKMRFHGVSVFCVSTKIYHNPCEMENKIHVCGGQVSVVKCSIQASTEKMFKKLFEEFKVAQVKTTGPIG